jgi:uncharacterized protein YcbX
MPLIERLDTLATDVWEKARAKDISDEERSLWVDAFVAVETALVAVIAAYERESA